MMKKKIFMILILAALLCSCGKSHEPGDEFPDSGHGTETVSDDEGADNGATLESVPEEPYIYYPYGTPAPEGIDNMTDKPMLIETTGKSSYDELSEAYGSVVKTSEIFINTVFNFDYETSGDFTGDIEPLMYEQRRFDFDKNIYTELNGAKVKSEVKDIHLTAVTEMFTEKYNILFVAGYFDADIEIAPYDGGESRIPYFLWFVKDEDGKWKIGNFNIQNVYKRESDVQVFLKNNKDSVFTIAADENTDLLFCFDFADPDGFISGYEQEDVEFAEEGTYVIKDEDGNTEILTNK